MDQSQNQTQPPDQLQRLNNITLRPRDTTNPSGASDGVQRSVDLFKGFSFTGAQEVENPQPQIIQFSTQIISGCSFQKI
ncbi:hypothetical protein F8M41_008122 [Gigaspora margarita]|uniref:Uncharacterized protein n=1 Tax=Gigaspora margarita TaxID=4874 RepID=A0A8H4EQW3_GIGMA|nr:hypothetical protein F8M41_008122 [Gigaspora margarita]